MGRKFIGLTLVTLRGSLGKLRQHITRQRNFPAEIFCI
jgi:hypothetical protein